MKEISIIYRTDFNFALISRHFIIESSFVTERRGMMIFTEIILGRIANIRACFQALYGEVGN